MSDSTKPLNSLRDCERRNRELAAGLRSVGLIWPGTVQKRMLTCGKPQCVCHRDPEARHGPYYYWTSKRQGKTVSKRLSADQAEIIGQWIANRKAVEAALRKMTETAERALELLLTQPDTSK